MVVSIVAPGTGARSGRVSSRECPGKADLTTSCSPGRPASSASADSSMPVWPLLSMSV